MTTINMNPINQTMNEFYIPTEENEEDFNNDLEEEKADFLEEEDDVVWDENLFQNELNNPSGSPFCQTPSPESSSKIVVN